MGWKLGGGVRCDVEAFTNRDLLVDSAKPTSKQDTTNAKYKLSKRSAISGRPSTRRWRRSMRRRRRSSMISWRRSVTSRLFLSQHHHRCFSILALLALVDYLSIRCVLTRTDDLASFMPAATSSRAKASVVKIGRLISCCYREF